MLNALREFLRVESAAGIFLAGAAALALVASNSALSPWYDALLDTPVSVHIGAWSLGKPLLLWINDGLMAIFFLLVGLEIKREILDGELSRPSQVALPAVAALGGMATPAAIYVLVSRGDPGAVAGWAIPSATDIAFSLGVLSLLGARIPLAVKVFLTAVAVLDDLGAIVIIALFYTENLSLLSLALAAAAITALVALNALGVRAVAPFVLVGVALWLFVLKSGVHATLAGVVLGLAIPLREDKRGHSPLRHLEHVLHPWVAFGILPLFAFANAGVSIAGLTIERLLNPVPLGIAAGLFLGKQIGILGTVLLMVKLRLADLPGGATWRMMYGVALLCGIGFTMSLFIGTLAFDDPRRAADVRLGVIVGSLLSTIAGYLVLCLTTVNAQSQKRPPE